MNTLSELRSGALQGATHIHLNEHLETFPPELLELSDTLRVLDLSGNRLSSLPADFSRFRNLEILFCSQNQFEVLPGVLGECPKLEMVGFKSNQIHSVSHGSLPDRLRWLILTDNRLDALPESLGERPRLQKLMLAGNRLRSLPDSLCHSSNLELLRISANRLEALPDWLFSLPQLAWLATSGNPCSWQTSPPAGQSIPWSRLAIGPALGRGASGETFRASWENKPLAVKVFKGKTTSDGTPEDEMATCLAAGTHPHLAGVLGEVVDHPEGRHALGMELLPTGSVTIGNPPDFQSCTRDTFPSDRKFPLESIERIVAAVASVSAHLLDRGIAHGDLYAHNILLAGDGTPYLTDFGAANRWDPRSGAERRRWETLEARAFGCLVDDLLTHADVPVPTGHPLATLRDACLDPDPRLRPRVESWKIG
ncbi:MAG: serine/threonine-protein kinase [Fibrobacterota bacterium]|nr:MAG: serine/threonine-protein kinase [Fibrobacterota bacterium]